MKRAPLKRKSWLRRLTRLNPINRKRRAALREKQFGEHAEWIRSLPCIVCGGTPVDPAHVRSRGAGGTAKDLVPLCSGPWGHHAEQHSRGIVSFEVRHEIDLEAEAARLWAESPFGEGAE